MVVWWVDWFGIGVERWMEIVRGRIRTIDREGRENVWAGGRQRGWMG